MCLSQLRQLGIATRLYADDNNNRLPAAERLAVDLNTTVALGDDGAAQDGRAFGRPKGQACRFLRFRS